MDIAFDTTWCPVCSRQILPKRYYVPIQPQPQAPVVPPSSPTSDPKSHDDAPAVRLPRNKTGTIRARAGGLVHGTGRVKPNGALKRDDTIKNTKKTAPTVSSTESEPALVRPAGPVRHRTVIDQNPVPLYCSDECRLADLQSSHGGIGIDYNPDRCLSPTLPPVPHNSFSDFSSSTEESDVGSGASYDSRSSVSSSPPIGIPTGYEALRRLYGDDLPPPPPPAPLMHRHAKDSISSLDDYQSGTMMAARRIKAVLASNPPKRGENGRLEDRKPIPGWTDGSSAWRASVYNLTAPQELNTPVDEERAKSAYKGFVASSHRSRSGVYSTLSEAAPTFESASAASLPARTSSTNSVASGTRSRSEAEEMHNKYPLFARRCESRMSLAGPALSTSPTGSTRSLPVATGRRKEFSLVKPGAEGRLLVPNVKMSRVPSTLSTMTMSSEASSSWGSAYYGKRRTPLSRQNSDMSIDSVDSRETEPEEPPHWPSMSLPATTRSEPRTRTWSYSDDTLTYPIMQMPLKKEKRIVHSVVDGKDKEVEVEVEVSQPLKRLFLFPGKEVN
ncbi:uncharacterized protein LAESUDRAFT_641577 [Laetiporus sulphureus 93-53]|uniref:Uncharacterized protein n=1 Tax=Laetiporus sulphureus 93-53 TaxID=1314785 RepID=A0A165HMN8_9APHY|nr:uncharacterized protein LAESUDRAFT_641577 [Laetiporus sulphureus 93-53]KZT11936.1 hypothetical protein LAESUDRAFT_641577 [Laetiporus sulphureus 93-53]